MAIPKELKTAPFSREVVKQGIDARLEKLNRATRNAQMQREGLDEDKRLEAMRVLEHVAKSRKVTVKQMLGKDRFRHIAVARQIGIYLLHVELDVPVATLAEMFGQHHTSILYSIRKMELVEAAYKEHERKQEARKKQEVGNSTTPAIPKDMPLLRPRQFN